MRGMVLLGLWAVTVLLPACAATTGSLAESAVAPAAANDAGKRLWEAAGRGDVETVRTLLAGHPPLEIRPDNRRTPLWVAASEGHEEVVALLIEAGANADPKGPLGTTPLMEAALGGHARVVEQLVRAGADMEWRHGSASTVLMQAALRDRHEVLRTLIALGADLNPTEHMRNSTALMECIIHGRIESVRILLAAGANPNHVARGGITPLMLANKRGDPELIRMVEDAVTHYKGPATPTRSGHGH